MNMYCKWSCEHKDFLFCHMIYEFNSIFVFYNLLSYILKFPDLLVISSLILFFLSIRISIISLIFWTFFRWRFPPSPSMPTIIRSSKSLLSDVLIILFPVNMGSPVISSVCYLWDQNLVKASKTTLPHTFNVFSTFFFIRFSIHISFFCCRIVAIWLLASRNLAEFDAILVVIDVNDTYLYMLYYVKREYNLDTTTNINQILPISLFRQL